MKKAAIYSLLLTVCVVLAPVWSQDEKPATTKTTSKEKEEDKLQGRLPNNFGKLGLSDEQKKQAYTIIQKYQTQLDELEQQLQALKVKRDQEITTILTTGQKARLKELANDAKNPKPKQPEKNE